MIGNSAVTILKEPNGALLFKLSAFQGGMQTVLDRIPTGLPGVYSWYRAFDYPDEPERLFNSLMRDLEAPKFIKRSGPIKPYYDITISSKSWFSDGKRENLRIAIEDPIFRRGLVSTLNLAVLLQSPLYIGKAIDLRKRISSHLKEGSTLRERLKQAEVEIERTLLLVLPNPLEELEMVASPMTEEVSFDESESSSGDNEEIAANGYEELYEEIYSRLFNPQFTIRLG
jgi:hypothetical protein